MINFFSEITLNLDSVQSCSLGEREYPKKLVVMNVSFVTQMLKRCIGGQWEEIQNLSDKKKLFVLSFYGFLKWMVSIDQKPQQTEGNVLNVILHNLEMKTLRIMWFMIYFEGITCLSFSGKWYSLSLILLYFSPSLSFWEDNWMFILC